MTEPRVTYQTREQALLTELRLVLSSLQNAGFTVRLGTLWASPPVAMITITGMEVHPLGDGHAVLELLKK